MNVQLKLWNHLENSIFSDVQNYYNNVSIITKNNAILPKMGINVNGPIINVLIMLKQLFQLKFVLMLLMTIQILLIVMIGNLAVYQN